MISETSYFHHHHLLQEFIHIVLTFVYVVIKCHG